MKRAALYARFSSDRQNENSVADQLELGRRHASARGWTVVAEFSDAAISGAAIANRPGLNALLISAEAGAFDVVLVEDTDRLARNREHDAHVYNRLSDAAVSIATFTTEKVSVIESALKGLMNELYVVQLSEKTKRGMRANAEAGKATGSRLYGYRTAPGGAQEIVDEEAEIIRRIFARYAAGDTARIIARTLNAECVPGPRGGPWNQSSISGSVQRGNGILNTELYIGMKVWGRMEVRKDRSTGKRRPKMLPLGEWKRTPVPHLRIIADDDWAAVRARKARNSAAPTQVQRRPGIFSGLLKCGACGGSYTAYHQGRLICATYREKGTCNNRRTPLRADVEVRALESLRDRILSPEATAAYVRTYRRAAIARRVAIDDRRAPLEKKLAELNRKLERAADAQLRGTLTMAGEAKMMEMERERIAVAADLKDSVVESPEAVELHPGAAQKYAAMVGRLRDTLNGAASGETPAQRELIDAVRGLIDRIVIIPLTQERGGPINLRLEGTLAGAQSGRWRPTPSLTVDMLCC